MGLSVRQSRKSLVWFWVTVVLLLIHAGFVCKVIQPSDPLPSSAGVFILVTQRLMNLQPTLTQQPKSIIWKRKHLLNPCFYCRYLISQGANVGGVNSEGETPLDIAEEEAMEELLQNEINRQGSFLSAWCSRVEELRLRLWGGGGPFCCPDVIQTLQNLRR